MNISDNQWLIRSRHVGHLRIDDNWTVSSHILGRTRIISDRSSLSLLNFFRLPRRPADLYREGVLSTESCKHILSQLFISHLLRPAGNGETARIRHYYEMRLKDRLPNIATSEPISTLADDTLQSLFDSETSLRVPDLWTHHQLARTQAVETSLVLSKALAVLPLDNGEALATHPLGHPVHLKSDLWQMALAFASPRSVDDVALEFREDGLAEDEVRAACEFLVRQMLLWTSKDEEEEMARRQFPPPFVEPMTVRYPAASRWRQKFLPYGVEDVKRTKALGTVALIGPCQIQMIAEALQFLAQRRGWYLDVEGFLTPEDGLSIQPWSIVVLSATQFAASFYEAGADQDAERCARLIPRLISDIDRAVDQIRSQTTAPLLVVSLSHPGLSPARETDPFTHQLNLLLANVNSRILQAIERFQDVYLLDEDRLVAEYSGDLYWDDEFNALPHHSAISSWSWVTLKPGITDEPYDGESVAAQIPTKSDGQEDPAHPLAHAVLNFLQELYMEAPVRLIVFDPNELLWRGRLEDRAEVYTSPPHFYADVEDYFYAGIHEALALLRQRGISLACVSTCPTEELHERWRIKSPLRHVVRLEDLECAYGGANSSVSLRRVIEHTGIREEEMLWISVCAAVPDNFRGRVYSGDRWKLRRHLLTAPELRGCREKESVAARTPVQMNDESSARVQVEADVNPAPNIFEYDEEDILNNLYEVLTTTLKCSRRALEQNEDLRLQGLDSLGVVELMTRLEDRFGIFFQDHDFVEPVVYHPRALFDAVVRGLNRKAEAGTEKGIREKSGEDIFAGLTYEEWCAQDVASIVSRRLAEPGLPWLLKIIRSPRPFDYQYVTHRQLSEQALGYTRLYRDRGIREGEVITILLPQSLELISALLGAILGRFVPSISAFPSDKLPSRVFAEWFGKVVKRSATQLIICHPSLRDLVSDYLREEEVAIPLIAEMPAPDTAEDYRTGTPRPDLPLLLQHSSGTTGLKKAILLNHRAVLSQVWELAHSLECDNRDVIVSWLPIYHDMGLICCTLLPLLCSLPTVVISPLDWVKQPHLLFQQISEERATLCWMPNFAFFHSARRVSERHLSDVDLTSLRAIISGAEPVTAAAQEAFYRKFSPFGLRFSALSSGYGLAEATAAVTQATPGRSCRRIRVLASEYRLHGVVKLALAGTPESETVRLVSSGPSLQRTAVEIVDEHGRALPSGRVGEIRLRSPSLMSGYFRDPELSSKYIIDGWFYPNDLGFILDDELYVVGRKDDLIINAGRNLSPHDLEEVISAVDGIHPGRVVAFGVYEPSEGTQRLVILAETNLPLEDSNQREQQDSLAERVRDAVLSAFGVNVSDVVLLERGVLRKSTAGKISRGQNRELYISGHLTLETGQSVTRR